MAVRLDIKPELQILSRITVLHRVIDEVSRSLGAPEPSLSIIRKGVLERQLLSEVIFCYMSKDALVGKVTLGIDWGKHQVFAQTEQGKSFTLNPAESIAKQLSGVFGVLTEHVAQLRRAKSVDDVSVWFQYRADVWNNSEKLKEARRFLGLSPGRAMPELPAGARFDVRLEFASKRLAELGLKIEHGK